MPTWSAPISLKGVKGDSTPQTLPNDLTPNSVAIAPVSGDTTASALTQRNAGGTTVFASDPSGNVACAGTLSAAGAANLAAVTASSVSTPSLTASTSSISGNESVGGNLSVAGTLTAGALTASGSSIGGDQTVTGNDTVNGNLLVKGSTSLQALTATSQQVSGTSSLGAVTCTSLSDTGNASVTGILSVGGATTAQAISATTVTTSGALRSNANLVVSGGADVGSLNSNGDAVIQGKLTVNKGAQVIGTFTGSGNAVVTGTLTAGNTTVDSLATNGNIRTEANLTASTGSTLLKTLTTSTASVAGNTTTGSLNVSGASTLGATNVGALSANSATVSGTTSSGSLSVSGTSTLATTNAGALTVSSASVANNATVGGTLAVTGSTSLSGITATGLVTAPNVTLTSGGGGKITFADGTTMATAAAAGGSSSGGNSGAALDTFFMGTFVNAGNNFPTSYTSPDAYFVNAQYSAQNVASRSGCAYTATYAANVYSIQGYIVANVGSATVNVGLYKNGSYTGLQGSYSGPGGGFYAATPTSAPISVAAGDILQFFAKSTSSTTSTPIVGWMSLQQAGVGAGSPARTAIEMGVYQYATNSAGGFSATKKAAVTAGSNTNGSNVDYTWIAPWPGSIVGYSFQQNSSNAATNSIIYRKNGTNNTSFTAGTGAGTFTGTHAVGTYAFAAGDKIQLLTGISNGGNTDINAMMYVQWSA